MSSLDVVVIGCSAGGIEALKALLAPLQSPRTPPIVVVQHRGNERPPILVSFFQSLCRLIVKEAESKEPLQKGHIYFAPAGYHLLVSDQLSLDLTVEEAVHFSRPSIDVLFESVASIAGIRVAGIILTGANEDGAKGLQKIVESGGTGIVQNPEEATFPQMPQAALNLAPTAQRMNLQEIFRFLVELSRAE